MQLLVPLQFQTNCDITSMRYNGIHRGKIFINYGFILTYQATWLFTSRDNEWAKNFTWFRLYDLLEVNDRKYKQAFWLNITSTLISRLYFAHETLFFICARTIKKEAKKIVANTLIAVWQLICYMTPEFKLPKRKTYLRNGIAEQNHLGKQLFLHFLWDRNRWRSGKTGV